MSEPRYDIFFRGECLENFNPEQVQQQVGLLFKASPEKIRQLFSGKVVALRKDIDKATTLKFKQALEKAGARIYIKAAAAAPASTTASTSPAPQATNAPTSIALNMLPVGSDLLTDDERTHIEAAELDISHIKLVSAFLEPEPIKQPAPPPAPDVSHLTTAEAGADLLEGYHNEIPVSAPDISHISLAEAGADLASLIAEMDAPLPLPDIEHITLADVGADIDPSEKPAPPPAPDVSYIQLTE